MDTDDLTVIRNVIHRAKKSEAETGHLVTLLTKELPHLHRAIRLPENNAVDALLKLILNYIDSVPNCLEAVARITDEAGIGAYTDVFLGIARDYFIQPPAQLEDRSRLTMLMSEAYLAHRLMEEINDRFIGRCGMPLAPIDMTLSNLIIHQLIGEPFANELDMAVQLSLELCIDREDVFESSRFKDYVAQRKQAGSANVLDDWPCLAEEMAISLQLSGYAEDADNELPPSKNGALH